LFCDGVCKKGKKKCGLLTEIIFENKKDGTVKNEEMCVQQAQLHSSLRIEGLLEGLHAAENSTRNEAAKGLHEIKNVIGTGMIGMIKSVETRDNGRPKLSD
jgi:hypothetical protein